MRQEPAIGGGAGLERCRSVGGGPSSIDDAAQGGEGLVGVAVSLAFAPELGGERRDVGERSQESIRRQDLGIESRAGQAVGHGRPRVSLVQARYGGW
jgi:hypothetical protein